MSLPIGVFAYISDSIKCLHGISSNLFFRESRLASATFAPVLALPNYPHRRRTGDVKAKYSEFSKKGQLTPARYLAMVAGFFLFMLRVCSPGKAATPNSIPSPSP